ncbi:MAG: glycogen synthase GlgA [Pseudomonadota bacterium]
MENDVLSVLVVSPEAAPLTQTGGLAEVTGSLPLALKNKGLKVAVAMPAYRMVMEKYRDWEVVAKDLPVRLGGSHISAEVLSGELAPGIPLYLIRRDEFYDRSELYAGGQGEYFDNPERFIFFSRAIPIFCQKIGFIPDVIQANDWQTGLVMALLDMGALPRTAGVFTVHNQGNLGLVPPERIHNIGLPDRYYTMEGLEYYGQMSLLKAGIIYSQIVTTVSPTYAKDVQTPEFGSGLDGVMRAVSHRLHGLLNGVDYQVWNPRTDKHLAAHYSPEDLSGKTICKQELLMKMGLERSLVDKPLLGMVDRLTAQKGCSLVIEAAEDIFKLDAGLVVLGKGEASFENAFARLQERYPGRMGLKVGSDQGLTHEIMAGCDIILMPSLYEPCGLAQMLGLKYGTVPVVRATGGLNDTVVDPRHGHDPGTGFKFDTFQPLALLRAVTRAVETFRSPERWRAMMLAGMNQDFSWDRSAQEYLNLFKRAVEVRGSRSV